MLHQTKELSLNTICTYTPTVIFLPEHPASVFFVFSNFQVQIQLWTVQISHM